MEKVVKFARQVALGAATGLGIALVFMLIGFTGGQGWRADRASRALAIPVMISLVGVLTLVVTVGPFKFLFYKMTEEDFTRRESMLPFTASLAITVLLIYLWVTPPLT